MALSQTISNANLDSTIAMGSSRRSKWTYYLYASEYGLRYEKDKSNDVINETHVVHKRATWQLLIGRPAPLRRITHERRRAWDRHTRGTL
jgi:hypothetical protein